MSNMMHHDEAARHEVTDQERLSQRLREAREYLGLSQEYIAEQLGVPRASVSAMETAKRKVSSIELKQLARLYKRPPSYFLEEDEAIDANKEQDETLRALFRTTQAMTDQDRQQVLRFAQFLRHAGPVPPPQNTSDTE